MRLSSWFPWIALFLLAPAGGFAWHASATHERALALGSAGARGAVATAAASVLVSAPGHRMGEFMVAADPTQPSRLALSGIDFDNDGGGVSCGTYFSADAGASWTRGADVPGLNDQPYFAGDPSVTFTPDHAAHLACLQEDGSLANYFVTAETGRPIPGTTPDSADKQLISTSADDGRTWSSAAWLQPQTPTDYTDKPDIFATREGVLLDCIADNTPDHIALIVQRSTDGGATWGHPIDITKMTGLTGTCNGFAEDASGAVEMVFDAVDASYSPVIGTATTFDQGLSWTNAHEIAPWDFPHTTQDIYWNAYGPSASTAPPPDLAVGATTGRVFVVVQAWDDAASRWTIDLYRSDDHGATYTLLAHPVISSATCPACNITRPALAADAQGRVALQVALVGGAANLTQEIWFLVSPDGGDSWLQPGLLSHTDATGSYAQPTNWLPGQPSTLANQTLFVATHPAEGASALQWEAVGRASRNDQLRWGGDYWGIAATPAGFLALWEDESTGYSAIHASTVTVR